MKPMPPRNRTTDRLPKRLAISWLACAAVCAVAGCERSTPAVKIGFAAPLTGDQAPLGQDMLRAARLAVEEVNARGAILPGYRLELVAADDQRSPTQAVALAKKLAADPDVLIVVGHCNSSCTMAASAVYHQARLAQVAPVSSNPQLSRQGFDTFFRICATDDLQGPAAALFAVKALGAKRIAVIDDRTTYGRGLSNEFEKKARALGADVLSHEGITQGDKDFTPLLTKLKSLHPDLVYFAGMFPDGALLIKQRFELGMSGVFMGGDGLFDKALITLATPQAAEGVYFTAIGSDIHQIPTAQAFVRTYEGRYGSVGAFSAYAYEGVSLAAAVIRQAGTKDRQAVLEAMRHVKDYPGLFGRQNFDARGDTLVRDIGLFTVKGGKFVFVKTAAWE